VRTYPIFFGHTGWSEIRWIWTSTTP